MLNCPLCGSEHLDGTEVCECGYKFAGAAAEMPSPPAYPTPQANLTIPGWLMSLAGVALGIYAMAFFDPRVEAPYVPGEYTSAASRTNNTGLLQQQLMLFMAGCSMLISGVVMLAAGAVIAARQRD